MHAIRLTLTLAIVAAAAVAFTAAPAQAALILDWQNQADASASIDGAAATSSGSSLGSGLGNASDNADASATDGDNSAAGSVQQDASILGPSGDRHLTLQSETDSEIDLHSEGALVGASALGQVDLIFHIDTPGLTWQFSGLVDPAGSPLGNVSLNLERVIDGTTVFSSDEDEDFFHQGGIGTGTYRATIQAGIDQTSAEGSSEIPESIAGSFASNAEFTIVPEPASLALLGMGGLMLMGRSRRRAAA